MPRRVKNELTAVFNCSLERAFKAPILGDATAFLNGYHFQPPVTGFRDDSTWGQVQGIRYPITEGNWLLAPGILMTDQIVERVENQYWKWTIYDFRSRSLFFLNKAIGEWSAAELQPGKIAVRYQYTFYPTNVFTYVLTALFCKIQWRGMMKKAMRGIKLQAESSGEFVYN